jgi:signal-transduction protein with cAMP-binding, CBS, and nucleotidyltransferase domain
MTDKNELFLKVMLSKRPFFNRFPIEKLTKFIKEAVVKTYKAGELILPNHMVGVVNSGIIHIKTH